MQNVNIHKQRLGALIIAVISIIFLFLRWWTQSAADFQFTNPGGAVGDFGLLSAAGIIGVIVGSLMGDKTQPYDKKTKMIVLASFGAMILGVIIHAIITSSKGGLAHTVDGRELNVKVSTGIGAWLTLVAGVIGLVWVSGILDQLMQQKAVTASAPPPPPVK